MATRAQSEGAHRPLGTESDNFDGHEGASDVVPEETLPKYQVSDATTELPRYAELSSVQKMLKRDVAYQLQSKKR